MTFKNRILGALSGVIISFLIVSSSLLGGASSFSEPQKQVCPVDSLLFEEGDILLRRGNSFISTMIVKAFPNGGGMSHCGILFNVDGSWQVLHSISGQISDTEGIRMEPFKSFVFHAKDYDVKHIKPLFEVKRDVMKEESLKLLRQKVGFDHDFDLDNTDKMYCSELVRAVYFAGGEQDPFLYKRIAGKSLIDMASFFWIDMWQETQHNNASKHGLSL
jgi:hypothetical protein